MQNNNPFLASGITSLPYQQQQQQQQQYSTQVMACDNRTGRGWGEWGRRLNSTQTASPIIVKCGNKLTNKLI